MTLGFCDHSGKLLRQKQAKPPLTSGTTLIKPNFSAPVVVLSFHRRWAGNVAGCHVFWTSPACQMLRLSSVIVPLLVAVIPIL